MQHLQRLQLWLRLFNKWFRLGHLWSITIRKCFQDFHNHPSEDSYYHLIIRYEKLEGSSSTVFLFYYLAFKCFSSLVNSFRVIGTSFYLDCKGFFLWSWSSWTFHCFIISICRMRNRNCFWSYHMLFVICFFLCYCSNELHLYIIIWY